MLNNATSLSALQGFPGIKSLAIETKMDQTQGKKLNLGDSFVWTSNLILVLGWLLCAYLFPLAANAYIDLGTGSFMMQIAFASVTGLLFSVKVFFEKFCTKLAFLKNEDNNSSR